MLGTAKSQIDFKITDSTLYLKAIQLSKDFLNSWKLLRLTGTGQLLKLQMEKIVIPIRQEI